MWNLRNKTNEHGGKPKSKTKKQTINYREKKDGWEGAGEEVKDVIKEYTYYHYKNNISGSLRLSKLPKVTLLDNWQSSEPHPGV